MFNYLIVGSGLFGSVFAHEAKKRGKTVLVLERRNHVGGNVTVKKKKASVFINTEPIFSILILKMSGIM